MKSTRWAILLALGGVAAILLVWFFGNQETGPIALEPVTIADGASFLASPVYVAAHQGFFKEEGLIVTLQSHSTGKATLEAVQGGGAQLATASETPTMRAILSDAPILILASMVTAERHNAIITKKSNQAEDLWNLSGKTLGATLGSNGEYVWDVFLTLQGISRQDVKLVHHKPHELHAALMQDEVAAVSIWNPHLQKLHQTLGEQGATFYLKDLYSASFLLAGNREWVQQHPQTIQKVLRALIKACQYLRSHPAESTQLVAQHLKNIDEATLQQLSGIYDFAIRLDQTLLITLENQANWFLNKQPQESSVPNFLNFIQQEPLHSIDPLAVTVIPGRSQ